MVKNTITRTEKIYLIKKYLDDESIKDLMFMSETEQDEIINEKLNNALIYCQEDIY